jgi:recombination protein RecT
MDNNIKKPENAGQTHVVTTPTNFRTLLATNYIKQINNFFGDEKKALKFLSGVMADVGRTPKLMECAPDTLINSYMVMAQLELMPSGVSGEAYVLPYNDKRRGMIAQFQLGYQGLVTLFYRAGVRSIVAEIVYENDDFNVTNGVITHKPDYFSDNRGAAKGAYVIVELQAGGKVSKVMSKKQILEIGQKFSKTFNSDFTPWNEKNDPDLWMWKKTALKQVGKLVPKNETIFKAIAEDNKDSVIGDRLVGALESGDDLKMGSLLKKGNENTKQTKNKKNAPDSESAPESKNAEGNSSADNGEPVIE